MTRRRFAVLVLVLTACAPGATASTRNATRAPAPMPSASAATRIIAAIPDVPDVIRLPSARGGDALIHVESDDGEFAMSLSERVAWVRTGAEAVSRFYGGFPVSHVVVALIPVAGEDTVVSGKTLTVGDARVVLRVGDKAAPTTLSHDWVLVHELFHLGFPSFDGEGEWLDEGLATYEEPLIRARAGILTEEEGWMEVTRGMKLGVSLCETTGLEHPGRDIRSIYWGGAVIALLADVEARRMTQNERGLEEALRGVLAQGGDATREWSLAQAVAVIDGVIGSPVLAPLTARYANQGNPIAANLDAALRDLGVERRGDHVVLHDDAVLAAARRRITYGSSPPPR